MNVYNPFKDPVKREQFEQIVKAFESYDTNVNFLFDRNGDRALNSFSTSFWLGYDGLKGGLANFSNAKFKQSGDYVFYCAGQTCRNIDKRKNPIYARRPLA